MGIKLGICSVLIAVSSLAQKQALRGKWDATVQVRTGEDKSVEIPFKLEVAGDVQAPQGWFFNGDQRVVSTSGTWQANHLTLRFAQYGGVLDAALRGGVLTGTYDRGTRGRYPFRAKPVVSIQGNSDAPSIAGTWELPVKSAKGESAWRFVVRQQGAQVSAAILRIDGDTGTLTGVYQDGVFRLSHFSGARPLLVEAKPQPDGSLDLILNGSEKYRAVKTEQARAAHLPAPTESFHHTSFVSNDPFQFAFPDLNGHVVSNMDSRFQGKVVLLAISGSWCPNCHDEAPYLESLYRKYRAQGLEVVALSFEEADQLRNPERLRAFIKQYGLDYTVLLAGEPEQLQAKLPQATNLNSWPTTVFLGRDGRVRGVHAGFASRATGGFYDEQAVEIETLLERLLHENLQSRN